RAHTSMVWQRQPRSLKVDEVQRTLQPFDFPTQIRGKKNVAAASELDLPPLPLGVGADAAVDFDEAVFGDVEQRRLLLADHPVDETGFVRRLARADREELEHVRPGLGERAPAFGEAILCRAVADAELALRALGSALETHGVDGQRRVEAG